MEITTYESIIRLASFAGVLVLMVAWEAFMPRRQPDGRRAIRWFSNLSLVVVDTVIVRILAPLGVVGTALLAEGRDWGVFNNIACPVWLSVILSIVALDLVLWLQHVVFHAVPALWRVHRVHHADPTVDATTGVRFHPIELVISLGVKAAAVTLLGAPPIAVLGFEILLNATVLFVHGNVQLPVWLDRMLRFVLVTPAMHHVHHSGKVRETNSNFGFNLPWWDYLFGTYCAEPAGGDEHMSVGLEQFSGERACWLHWMLLIPFLNSLGESPSQPSTPESAPDCVSAPR